MIRGPCRRRGRRDGRGRQDDADGGRSVPVDGISFRHSPRSQTATQCRRDVCQMQAGLQPRTPVRRLLCGRELLVPFRAAHDQVAQCASVGRGGTILPARYDGCKTYCCKTYCCKTTRHYHIESNRLHICVHACFFFFFFFFFFFQMYSSIIQQFIIYYLLGDRHVISCYCSHCCCSFFTIAVVVAELCHELHRLLSKSDNVTRFTKGHRGGGGKKAVGRNITLHPSYRFSQTATKKNDDFSFARE